MAKALTTQQCPTGLYQVINVSNRGLRDMVGGTFPGYMSGVELVIPRSEAVRVLAEMDRGSKGLPENIVLQQNQVKYRGRLRGL